MPSHPTLKVVLVGDAAVGKTSLLNAYATKRFSEDYRRTTLDNQQLYRTLDETTWLLDIWDTGGSEQTDEVRPRCYGQANVFLVCFDLGAPGSLHSVWSRWRAELPAGVPRVLVGMKEDAPSAVGDATGVAAIIGATRYVTCSAREQSALKAVFEEAVRAATGTTGPPVHEDDPTAEVDRPPREPAGNPPDDTVESEIVSDEVVPEFEAADIEQYAREAVRTVRVRGAGPQLETELSHIQSLPPEEIDAAVEALVATSPDWEIIRNVQDRMLDTLIPKHHAEASQLVGAIKAQARYYESLAQLFKDMPG